MRSIKAHSIKSCSAPCRPDGNMFSKKEKTRSETALLGCTSAATLAKAAKYGTETTAFEHQNDKI